MKFNLSAKNHFIVKLIASVLCICMLSGSFGLYAFADELENIVNADDPFYLVDIYCSQTAKDALGDEQLQNLIDLIVTSVEPQAVNLLIERFPCFQGAAENGELGSEIGLYIYYGTGNQDGIEEHENVAPGSYAYVLGGVNYEDNESIFEYMIGIDSESLCTFDDMNNALLDLDGQTRIQLDTTFCHELFHAFMDDYNRVGMSGYTDFESYLFSSEDELTTEEGDKLIEETMFPNWFQEGLAGCVGNIYPADLELFREYRFDLVTWQYLDACTPDQLCRMYANMGYQADTGEGRFDLEASAENNDDGHDNGATYVSGYMACLYLADLAYQKLVGDRAVTFDQDGNMVSISSEKLRTGISEILHRLHEGNTLDEVICDISDGAYENTSEFTKRFIKGTFDENAQDYIGDPESLSFCAGYINYMNALDVLDPDTHPAGSLLMDDFGSTLPTPLTKNAVAASDYYRIVESNVLTTSTVSNENLKDGGTSYSAIDCFESVVEFFRENHI